MLLFLDIDGVLNCSGFLDRQRAADVIHSASGVDYAQLIDPIRVDRLNRIIEATGAHVVLSSGWRIIAGMATTQAALDANGASFVLCGETVKLPSNDRSHEIMSFLLQGHTGKRYVILDDLQTAGLDHAGRFVHVLDGLEDEHVDRAIEILSCTGAV